MVSSSPDSVRFIVATVILAIAMFSWPVAFIGWVILAVEYRRDVRKATRDSEGSSPSSGDRPSARGPRPAAQLYGVSHDGAERLVAGWMSHLDATYATATRFTQDGGIDVQSSRYIAQVKNYAGTVGVKAVRELAGVAAVDGQRPLFFTSGNYTADALMFARSCGVALFIYHAVAGTLVPVNTLAKQLTREGL